MVSEAKSNGLKSVGVKQVYPLFDDHGPEGDQIRELVAKPWYDWRFPPQLEKHFADDIRDARTRQFRTWLLLVALLPMLSFALHFLFQKPLTPWTSDLFIASAIICLAAFFLLGLRLPDWVQDAAFMVTNVALVSLLAAIALLSPERAADRCLIATGVYVLLQNLSLRIGPPQAICLTISEILAFNAILISGFSSHSQAINFDLSSFSSAIMLLSLFVYAQIDRERRKAWFFGQSDRNRVLELAMVNEELQALSNTDPLTGVANRRFFNLSLQQFWVKAAMHGQPLSLLMLDVDHFKKFNDTLGHTEGDDCLREVAQTIELNIRKDIDVAARFGGEEFIVLLPNANAEIAYEIAERIRKAVELLPLCSAWPLTVSIGVATAYFGPGQDTAEGLLHRADMALYQAKAGGRNLTVVAGEICQDYARLLEVEGYVLVPGSSGN